MQSLPSVFIFTAISVANSQQDNLAFKQKKTFPGKECGSW
jgi:hypothetical protein